MNITLEQLKQILDEQKKEVAEYITRNMTVYSWYENIAGSGEKVRTELKAQCLKAPYSNDYKILEKYNC